MNLSKAVFTLLLAGNTCFAGVQIGLNLNADVNSTITTSSSTQSTLDTRTVTAQKYIINPYIGIRPGDMLEIAPSVNFQIRSNSTETEYNSSTTATSNSSSQLGLGLGIAVLFHVVRNDHMELGFGPELSGIWYLEPNTSNESSSGSSSSSQYSKYYNSIEQLAMPITFDFYFSKKIGLRMSSKFLAFTYDTHSFEYKNSSSPDVVHDLDFAIATNWIPTFGLFIRF